MLRLALAVALPLVARAAAPTGLLADWQSTPALGVSAAPALGWIVPACDGQKDAMQTAYTITVHSDGDEAKAGATPVWDSGKVAGNASVAVKYGGPALKGGAAYHWTVKTWAGSCASEPSAPALFITALGAFRPGAKWIGAGVSNATFNLARRVVQAPAAAKVRRAIGYITAQNSDPTMLMNYKLYINGNLASTGPGRGEAPVWGGDGPRLTSSPPMYSLYAASSGVSRGAVMKACADTTPAGTTSSLRKYANVFFFAVPFTEIHCTAVEFAKPSESSVMNDAGAEGALSHGGLEAAAVHVVTVHEYGVPGLSAGPAYMT